MAAPVSVLRYPGGKTRAAPHILPYFPPGLSDLCSPFLGGASLELTLAASGVRVYGSDAFPPLIDFWSHALRDPVELAGEARMWRPLTRTGFYALQAALMDMPTGIARGAAFYALNRASFSGTVLSGGMSPGHPRFDEGALERLAALSCPLLSAELLDYRDALARHPGRFLYLDPPYDNGGRLYGDRGGLHAGFDHEALAEALRERRGWILSYSDSPEIRRLYSGRGFRVKYPKWGYGMSGNRRASAPEILIICE